MNLCQWWQNSSIFSDLFTNFVFIVMSKAISLGDILKDEVLLNGEGNECMFEDLDFEYFGILFSANWCGPCNEFMPMVAKLYEKIRKESPNKLEIIFVSEDRNEEQYEAHRESQPWLSLPYGSDAIDQLNAIFVNSGIPVLGLVSKDGRILHSDVRDFLRMDENAIDFPWTPKSLNLVRTLTEHDLVQETSKLIKFDDLPDSIDTIGLYFSAQWCQPCKAFTRKLRGAYAIVNEKSKQFEIVYCSSDQNFEQYTEYCGQMPWLKLPFEDKRIELLKNHFNVHKIPTLVIVNRLGNVINEQARAAIESDTKAEQFPWFDQPLQELTLAAGDYFNDCVCVFLMLPKDASDELVKSVIDTNMGICKKLVDKHANLKFFYGVDDEMVKEVLTFCKFPRQPFLALMNIPKGRKAMCADWLPESSGDILNTFIEDYFSAKVPTKLLKR
eukprot:TRINITY_DN10976_c0_g2_i1.p1 TRINITY_DN10976_c0_g2~~TRINITY_DN10976_c0_g2_i1.p1  ORF type:complete len:442 (-),score=93.61 TRINITY_DN10976_c0_g2_i1:227-1552(-)